MHGFDDAVAPDSVAGRDATIADYEVLREVWNQLHGLLLARANAALDPTEKADWLSARDAALRRLDEIDPMNRADVRTLLDDWTARVAALRDRSSS